MCETCHQHLKRCRVAAARYVSPDAMQPSKGVLAAAAVRELKFFIENAVLKNDSAFKVCQRPCSAPTVGTGWGWVDAIEVEFTHVVLGRTHMAPVILEGAALVRRHSSPAEGLLIHPGYQYHPLPPGDHGDVGELGDTGEACLDRDAQGIREKGPEGGGRSRRGSRRPHGGMETRSNTHSFFLEAIVC